MASGAHAVDEGAGAWTQPRPSWVGSAGLQLSVEQTLPSPHPALLGTCSQAPLRHSSTVQAKPSDAQKVPSATGVPMQWFAAFTWQVSPEVHGLPSSQR